MGANHALRRARQERGWSQTVVATKLDTSPKNVSRWECGVTRPSPYFQTRLCQLFDANAQTLGLLEPTRSTPAASLSFERSANTPSSPILDPQRPRLVASPGQLIERHDLLDELLTTLQKGVACVLYGLPGVGKTTTAHMLSLHPRTRTLFPDGLLWISLGLHPSVHSELLRLTTLLGAPEAERLQARSVTELAHSVHSLLGERHVLLVIDDAWSVEAVLPLLVGGPYTAHVITTRLPELAFSLPAARPLAVPELDAEQSRALLLALVPSLTDHAPEAVQDLLQSTGGLPLALTLLGHYLRTQAIGGQRRRLEAALKRLVDASLRLSVSAPLGSAFRSSSATDPTSWSLERVIGISDHYLTPATQQTLRALSVLPAKPARFSEAAALAVSGHQVEALDHLLDAGLLEGAGEGWYSLHQAIADYAGFHLDDPAPSERLLQYALVRSRDQRDLGLLAEEHPTLLAALHVSKEGERVKDQILLVHTLAKFWQVQGRFVVAEQELRQALAAARTLQDRPGIVQVLSDLARIALPQGHEQDAEMLLREAETLARAQDFPSLLFEVLSHLGTLHYHRGNLKSCEHVYQEAFLLAQRQEDSTLLSRALNNLGVVAVTRGQVDEGIHYWQEQLAQDRLQQNKVAICHTQANLGRVFAHRQGKQEMAHLALQEALTLAEYLDFQEERSDIRYWLAELARWQGTLDQAEDYIRDGLAIARKGGQRREIILLLEQAAYVAGERGDLSVMETTLVEAEERARDLKNPFIYGIIQQCWGQLRLAQQQLGEASTHFEQARQTFEAQEEVEFVARAEYGLAQTLAAQGKTKDARHWGEQSLTRFVSVHHLEVPHVQAWLEQLSSKRATSVPPRNAHADARHLSSPPYAHEETLLKAAPSLRSRIVLCPFCQQADMLIKRGKTRVGVQRYSCHRCQRSFVSTLTPSPLQRSKEQAQHLAATGWNSSAIGEHFGVHRTTIIRWLAGTNRPVAPPKRRGGESEGCLSEDP